MGVAGAGKSLQGKLFAKELNYQWVSTGEIFRAELSEDRQKDLLAGKLLDDTEVIAIVDRKLKNLKNVQGIVLDGFPRTIVQAEWLLGQVRHQRFDLKAVFNLVATREVVKARLLARGRSDDNEKVIAERFNEYENKTIPIINFLKENNVNVQDVDANQIPEAVHETMMKLISK